MKIIKEISTIIIAVLVVLNGFYGCEDIIEDDITDASLTLFAPTDGVNTKITTQTFWWEEVKGATEYRIIIVTPSYDSIASIILDSAIVNTSFQYNFNQGDYEWRVIASNYDSYTESDTNSFKIIDSDLSQLYFSLLSPPNNNTINDLTQTFWWEKIQEAETYNLQVVITSFTNVTKLVLDTTLIDNKINLTLPEENDYQWKVVARNSSSFKESGIFSFTADTTSN